MAQRILALLGTIQTEITDLETEVFDSNGDARLATASALTGLTNTVITQGGDISTLQTDVTDLETEVFDSDGNVKLATTTALSGLLQYCQHSRRRHQHPSRRCYRSPIHRSL